jgi:hypothetical protein
LTYRPISLPLDDVAIMASFDSRAYAHVARALKRAPSASVVSNTPTATALSESTPTPSVDVASVASIPNNVPALVAVISILAAIILGEAVLGIVLALH